MSRRRWIIPAFMSLLLGLVVYSFLVPREFTHDPRSTKARSTMVSFVLGVKQYRAEYDRLPLPLEMPAGFSESMPQRTMGEIVQALIGKEEKINPRRIAFVDPPQSRNGRHGLYLNPEGTTVLADPWGEPYYVIFDLNGDGKIPNPDPRDNKKHPFIEAPVILYSAGPDRDVNTWNDNVLSWK